MLSVFHKFWLSPTNAMERGHHILVHLRQILSVSIILDRTMFRELIAYLASSDSRIPCSMTSCNELRNWLNHSLKVCREEKGHRIPLLARVVHDSVPGRDVTVVGPCLQLISNIYDETAFAWGSGDPLPRSILDLKSTNFARCENSKD